MKDTILNSHDIEKAIEINRLPVSSIETLIGLYIATTDLATSFLALEHLTHHETLVGESTHVFRDFGRLNGQEWRRVLQPIICEDWGFCSRRSESGFGDSRVLFAELAKVIAPSIIKDKSFDLREQMYLILLTVYLSRSSLTKLCECSNKRR
jgi:hypothetical protein